MIRTSIAVSVACLLLACGAGGAESPPPTGELNLVFISLDTVRRDHLPTYGYPRETAPKVDELARRSVVFDEAYAQDSNTNPSHASMFTGVYPHQHGSLVNGKILAGDQITLARILRAAGFRTGGFVSAAAMKGEATGLERGFEIYDDGFRDYRRDGDLTTQSALAWLSRLTEGERYFLFLHLYDAHGPYVPRGHAGKFRSADSGKRLERVPVYQRKVVADRPGEFDLNTYVDRYDACIRDVDDQVGTLVSRIDLENTVVVLLADHGESLGERYWPLDHGAQAFEEQFRIPLMIHAPGVAPRRAGQVVETIDLLPTLLELLDVERPEQRYVSGASLTDLMRTGSHEPRAASFSSARAITERHADRGYDLDPERKIHAVRSSGWKLLRYPGVERDYLELYNLGSDSGELSNVAAEKPQRVRELTALLDGWLALEQAAQPSPQLDPELRKQLESLGYVDPKPKSNPEPEGEPDR